MTPLEALEGNVDRLEARLSRVESLLLIERMKNQKPSKEVEGLLKALEKLPQMAPYVMEDDDEGTLPQKG